MTHDIERLRADIAEVLRLPVEEVTDDENLMDLGLDSMRVMNLLVKWESEGLKMDFSALAEHATLGGWWDVISATKA